MKSLSVTIQMKATEQYFPVVLFIMLYKVVLTFESVDEILKCDHSNEGYWTVLSYGTVYCAVQGGSYFLSLLTNMPLCKNNHTTAQAFNKEKLSVLRVIDSKQFSKISFSSTEEERASDDETILNVTIIFLVYLENFVNNLLDKKYSLSSAEL